MAKKVKTNLEREERSKVSRDKLKAEERKALELAKVRAEFEKKNGRKYAGDYLEDLFKVTGVKALVDALVEDCGCEDRKAALNGFHEDFVQRYNSKRMWDVIYDSYEKVFGERVGIKQRRTQCGPCHKRRVKKLRHWFMQKKIEHEQKNG